MTSLCRLAVICGRSLLVLAVAASSTHARAAQLWGIDLGGRLSINPMPIDIATGFAGPPVNVTTPESPSGFDLASDPSRQPNLLWALRWNASGSRIVGFNPLTAEVKANVLLDSPTRMLGLAIDPADGIMYGNTDLNLYTINPTTGVTTLVGPMETSNALGFDSLGRLLAVNANNNLLSVDKLTGTATFIGNLGQTSIADIATDPDTGLLYGLDFRGLYRIDPLTAGTTFIGNSVSRPAGLAFTNIPEPTTLVLVMLLALTALSKRERG